jgi:hypothetical protein
MLEPLKLLSKLWDKVEKSGMTRRRKDFLLTAIALAIVLYVLAFPVLVVWLKQVTDMIEKVFGL